MWLKNIKRLMNLKEFLDLGVAIEKKFVNDFILLIVIFSLKLLNYVKK